MPTRLSAALIPPLPALADHARVLVAYSGGLDSTVLLHALNAVGVQGLTAVHVHHGLQPDADAWADAAARFCAAREIPLIVCKAQIAADDRAGPEAAARVARYALLREQMRPGDLLVTAHHRDDQAETVLLRLLRGAGVPGLAAMRALVELAPGRLWRPLLDQPRAALLAHAQRHALTWIDDPHNDDPRYARSWLRQHVLPPLRTRYPQIDDRLARTAQLAAEAAELLDERAAEDLAAMASGAALSVSAISHLSPARRHNLIRWWLTQQQFLAPFAMTLDRIDRELLAVSRDAEPLIRWPGCELRRHGDRIFAMAPLPAEPPPGDWGHWRSVEAPVLPPGCGKLVGRTAPPRPIRVRSLQPGESIRPAGHRQRKRSRNLFQERAIPRWVRRRLPVLDAGDDCVCIIGLAATAAWHEAAAGWSFEWRHALAGMPSPIGWPDAPLHSDCP